MEKKMVNLKIDPNSHAISVLAEQVKRHRGHGGSEDLKNSVSSVLSHNIKQNDALVEDIEKKQFKPGQDVPIDFYINLKLADSRIISILSQTLIEKISSEPQP